MSRDVSYIGYGPGNQLILGDVVLQYPPTSNDIPSSSPSGPIRVVDKVNARIGKITKLPKSLRLSLDINQIKYLQRIDDHLPLTNDSAKSVYLVT